MITRIEIRNFQCHERLDLDLRRVSCLVGESDLGKSACLRALEWLARNDPAGDEFIRTGASWVKVTAWMDGRKISRKKGKGVNEYRLDGRVFKAFGTGKVPDEIATLLNVNEWCFQGQLDPPFWLGLTPGQASKELNAVVNLEQIDRTLAFVGAAQRKAKATEEVRAANLAEARSRKRELSHVPEMAQNLEALEYKQDLYCRKAQASAGLADLLEQGVLLGLARRNAADAALGAGQALLAGEKVADLTPRIEELGALLGKANELEEELCRATEQLEGLQQTLTKALAGHCPLCGRGPTSSRRSSVTSISA